MWRRLIKVEKKTDFWFNKIKIDDDYEQHNDEKTNWPIFQNKSSRNCLKFVFSVTCAYQFISVKKSFNVKIKIL